MMTPEELIAWAKEFADRMEVDVNVPRHVAPRLRIMASMIASGRKIAEDNRQRVAQEAELRAALMDNDLGARVTVSPTKRFVVTFSRIESGHTVATGLAQGFDEAVRLALVDKKRNRGR